MSENLSAALKVHLPLIVEEWLRPWLLPLPVLDFFMIETTSGDTVSAPILGCFSDSTMHGSCGVHPGVVTRAGTFSRASSCQGIFLDQAGATPAASGECFSFGNLRLGLNELIRNKKPTAVTNPDPKQASTRSAKLRFDEGSTKAKAGGA